jgi:hypothetical protein
MNMRTRLALAALLTLALAPCFAKAQSEKAAKREAEAATTQAQANVPKEQPQPFLLTISVKETVAGKAAVEKSYSLTVVADDRSYRYETLRDGDRIPYTGEKGREYFDVGTNIDITDASRHGESLAVNLRVESSSLTAKADGVNLPQVNQWKNNIVAILVPGKPTVVYAATDGITGHKVEIQATAQLLNVK